MRLSSSRRTQPVAEKESTDLREVARYVEPVVLNPRAISEFFESGFVVVDRLTSEEEVVVLRAMYDRFFRERLGEADGLYTEASSDGSTDNTVPFPKIHQIFDLVPELCESGFVANATRIAKQLFDDNVRFLGGRAMLKPPLCPQQTPWHQDPAYHRPDRLYLALPTRLPCRRRSDAFCSRQPCGKCHSPAPPPRQPYRRQRP
jgi:hypothetical protein